MTAHPSIFKLEYLRTEGAEDTVPVAQADGSLLMENTQQVVLNALANDDDILVLGSGAFTSDHGLGADDVAITSDLEVDGTANFDGFTRFSGFLSIFENNVNLIGSLLATTDSTGIAFVSSTTGAVLRHYDGQFLLGVGSTYADRAFIVTDIVNREKQHGQGLQDNPTLFVFSKSNPVTYPNRYLSLTYERITTGYTVLNLGADASSSHSLGAGDILIGNDLEVKGDVFLDGIPTADPHVIDQLWNNSGVLTVSAG